MGITEILRRIWLFSANKIKSSESFSKQPTQLIFKLNSSLQHINVTLSFYKLWILILDHPDTGQIWKESFDCEPMPSSWRFVLPVVCFTFFIILMTYLCEPWILPYFFPTKVQETVALGEFENRDFAPFSPCFLMCFCLWFAVQVVFKLVWIKLILVWK